MSEQVQFETDYYLKKTIQPAGERGMAGWLIRHGFAKDFKSAQILMVAISIIDLVIIVLILVYFL